MLWIEELFGVKKPIISMLHFDPLPGDPRWKESDSLDTVIEHARQDLHALQDAEGVEHGVGLLVECRVEDLSVGVGLEEVRTTCEE